MNKTHTSTFEREMQDKTFKKQFSNEYTEFLLSETIREFMEKEHKPVQKFPNEKGDSYN